MGTAPTQTSHDAEPADCHARVGLVSRELESLRLEMGRPVAQSPALTMVGVKPREVYFIAQAMFRKAERFCFEQTGQRATLPAMPSVPRMTPGDVLAVLDAGLERIRHVKLVLGVIETCEAPQRNPLSTPSDVFRAVLAANSQLNALLEQQFAPEDVFEQVGLAVGYASALLSRFPSGSSAPELPAFERGKQPVDCYRKLGESIDRAEVILGAANLEMMDVTLGAVDQGMVIPSDVYDLASLLVAELAYLHSEVPGLAAPKPYESDHRGRKLPSHVYRCAGLLDAQLTSLQSRIAQNPDALRARK